MRFNSKDGFALPLALMIVVICAIFGLTLLKQSGTALTKHSRENFDLVCHAEKVAYWVLSADVQSLSALDSSASARQKYEYFLKSYLKDEKIEYKTHFDTLFFSKTIHIEYPSMHKTFVAEMKWKQPDSVREFVHIAEEVGLGRTPRIYGPFTLQKSGLSTQLAKVSSELNERKLVLDKVFDDQKDSILRGEESQHLTNVRELVQFFSQSKSELIVRGNVEITVGDAVRVKLPPKTIFFGKLRIAGPVTLDGGDIWSQGSVILERGASFENLRMRAKNVELRDDSHLQGDYFLDTLRMLHHSEIKVPSQVAVFNAMSFDGTSRGEGWLYSVITGSDATFGPGAKWNGIMVATGSLRMAGTLEGALFAKSVTGYCQTQEAICEFNGVIDSRAAVPIKRSPVVFKGEATRLILSSERWE